MTNTVKMNYPKFSRKVANHLDLMEELAKIGSLEIAYYNRCLDFCMAIYSSKDKDSIDKMIESEEIQPLVIFQVLKEQPQLIDENELSEEVYQELVKYKDYEYAQSKTKR